MNRQQAFTAMVLGIVDQGKPSYDGDNCLYHGPDGTRCVVGIIMPDDFYKPDFDLQPTGVSATGFCEYSGLDEDFLGTMQNAHDNAAPRPDFVENFLDRCREIAKEFNLEMPDVEA